MAGEAAVEPVDEEGFQDQDFDVVVVQPKKASMALKVGVSEFVPWLFH